MSLLVAGTGRNGVALVIKKAPESEVFAKDPLRGFAPLWKALRPGQDRDDFLRISLQLPSKATPSTMHAAWAEALEVMEKAKIHVIMPVAGAVRLATHISDKSSALVGSLLPDKHRWVIPLDYERYGGQRATRSHMWNIVQAGFIRRALNFINGRQDILIQPDVTTGSNAQTLAVLRRMDAKVGPVGIDLETAGVDPRAAAITAFGIADKYDAVSVPWHGYYSSQYGPQPGLPDDEIGREIRALVLRMLANSQRIKIFHNGAFDTNMLRGHQIPIAGTIEDTILAHRVCYPDLYHNLQFCMSHRFLVYPWKTHFKMERKARREPADDWSNCEPLALQEYNARDAATEVPLWDWLAPRLHKSPWGWDQYQQLKELAAFAAECRWHGVAIDKARVSTLDGEIVSQLAKLGAEWKRLTDDVPVSGKGSKAALHKLFFETLHAPVSQWTDTGEPSLSSAALLDMDSPLQPDNRLADIAFLKFRINKLTKAKTAFLDPLAGAERIYPELDAGGTKGTRMSCRNPNIQQWSKPKDTRRPRTGEEVKLAPPLRQIVVPDPGFVLVESDANALEARLVAYAANVPIWLEWMAQGIDMHIEHVWLMFGQRVTKKNDPANLREITKTLTYARFYNDRASVDMVLRSLKPKMPTLTASFLQEVFARFDKARPEIRDWQLERRAFIQEWGYVETGMGGWRQMHDKRFPDVNQAYSFSIQSTGGAFMNEGMLRLNRRLDHKHMRILFQVHDSLVCQARPEAALELTALIAEEMERPVDLWNHRNVVIPFESKIGPNWAEMISPAAWLASREQP